MKILYYNRKKFLLAFIIECLLICFAISSIADETKTELKKDGRIYISADQLLSDAKSSYAQFSGNVKVTQDDTVINADTMIIYYNNDKKTKDQQKIKKIIAKGNIVIKFQNTLATTEEAEYTVKEKILVLKGAGTKVTSENNYFTGDKIILNRSDGSVKAEGSSVNGKREPVKAVIYTDKNILN